MRAKVITPEYELRLHNIHEITEAEARDIIQFAQQIWPIKHREKWGGLFLYKTHNRDRSIFHPRKFVWVAIDDSSKELFVKNFSRKQKAIDWLCKTRGPKLCRI